MPTIAWEVSFRPLGKCCKRTWRLWRWAARRTRSKNSSTHDPRLTLDQGRLLHIEYQWISISFLFPICHNKLGKICWKTMCFLNLPVDVSAWGYSLVLDMHTFNDPKHNGTQSRLKTSLEKVAKKYDVQLGEGSDAWIAWIGDGACRVGWSLWRLYAGYWFQVTTCYNQQ